VSTPKQRIQLLAEPGFQHLDLGVGNAKGAVNLELNRPTGLLVRFLRPVAGRRGGRVVFLSAAIVQSAVLRARIGSRDGSSGLLGGRRFCGWLRRSIRRLAVEMTIGLLHRERGLFDHGDHRCLGVPAGQSIGEQRAPLFGRCRLGLLRAIQRQTGREQRVDLGAIDDEPGLVAGAARGHMHGTAIEQGIEEDDRPIDGHALRSVHGAGIGPADPRSSAMSAGTKLMRRRSMTAFYTDGAGCRLVFRGIRVDGGHNRNRAVNNAQLIVAKLEADLVAGRDFQTGWLARRRNRLDARLRAVNGPLVFEFRANRPRDIRPLFVGPGDQEGGTVRMLDPCIVPEFGSPVQCSPVGGSFFEAAVRLECVKRVLGLTRAEIRHGLSRPGVTLAHNGVNACGLDAADDEVEAGTRANRLQLPAIADEDRLGLRAFDLRQQRMHLPRGQKAGFIHDDNRLVVKEALALLEGVRPRTR
jgi:hypothetical protein